MWHCVCYIARTGQYHVDAARNSVCYIARPGPYHVDAARHGVCYIARPGPYNAVDAVCVYFIVVYKMNPTLTY